MRTPSLASPDPAAYAHACVEAIVEGRALPRVPADALYRHPAGCFVSIKAAGDLRGCIGTLAAAEAHLGAEIAHNARSAALSDPRFPPVVPEELASLTYSVDVLSDSDPCTLDDLDPRRFGVIVESGWRRGVLLPDLPGVDTVARQVAIALQKAGISPSEPFVVKRFTVTRYREHGDDGE